MNIIIHLEDSYSFRDLLNTQLRCVGSPLDPWIKVLMPLTLPYKCFFTLVVVLTLSGWYGLRLRCNSAVVPEALIRAGASTVPCYSCQDTERRETAKPTMCPMLWSENSITEVLRRRRVAHAR